MPTPSILHDSFYTNRHRVNPHQILLVNVLPLYAEDAQEMVVRVIEQVNERGEEIDLEDGFDLYKKLTGIRHLFVDALPEYDFILPSVAI